MSYVNGKPVGLTYSSSTNKPVGLTELSSIAVTLVSATNFSGITLSSMGDINFTGLDDNYVLAWDAAGGTWQVEPQSGGGGGGGGNSFTIFNVPLGTDPEADTGADTINFTTTSNKVTITGNSATDTIDFDVNEAAFSDPRSPGASLADILDTVEGNISTNATNLSNHTGNASIHFAVTSIDHGLLTGLLDPNDHPQYALTATLANYATTASLGNYATTASLNSYATTASLGNYATTASLAALELDDLFDVNAPTPGNGQVLMYFTGTGNWQATSISVTGGGATTFLDLEDTPDLENYNSVANRFVIVNQDGNALEFSESLKNSVMINSDDGIPEALEVGQFIRKTLLGNSTNITTYSFSGAASGTSVETEWPDGTLMTYELGTSSFNLSSPADWWTVVAPTFNHNTLNGLTVGNPHTQYVLSSTNLALSSAVSSLQTSTINLSAYIAANEAAWASGGGSASSFSSILFVTGITPSLELGEIAWNEDYSTIDIQTSTDTTLQVGQEQVIKVRNETGSTLLNGTVVYVSGVHGTGAAKLQVAKASANTDCTIQNIVGICTQDISHNSDGFITTFGYVRDVNTSAFSVGDVVYLANTAGEYINTQEAKPSHSIRLGTVARSHATDGVIFVKVDPGYDTTFLHDVENDPPESSGQVLIWNSTSSLYQHGGHNDLTDLTVGNPHTQYVLSSTNSSLSSLVSNIEASTIALSGHITLTDMQLLEHLLDTGNVHPQYATLSGATFTGGVTASSVSANAISAITVNGGTLAVATYTNIQNNDILKWQSSTSSWVNASGNLSTSDTLTAGDMFYYNGTSVKKIANPGIPSVLAFDDVNNSPYWVQAEAGGGNLTLVYNDEDSTIVFSAV